MTKIKNTYDDIKDLKNLNLRRLFLNQKLLLKELDYYLYTEDNKNLAYNSLQNIIVINQVINKKLEKIK